MSDDYDEFDDEPYDDEDDLLDECGLMNDGQCMMAGSEWCDFTCPMRDSEFFAGSRAWIEKHKAARKRRSRKSEPELPALNPSPSAEKGR